MKNRDFCEPVAFQWKGELRSARIVPHWAPVPDALAFAREGALGRAQRYLHQAWSCLSESPGTAVDALARAEEVWASLSATVPGLIRASLAAEISIVNALLALVLSNPERARERLREAEMWEEVAGDPHLEALHLAVVSLLSVVAGEPGRAVAAAQGALGSYRESGAKLAQLQPFHGLLAYLMQERYGIGLSLEEGLIEGEVRGGEEGEPFEDADLFVNCLRAQPCPEAQIEAYCDPDWEAL